MIDTTRTAIQELITGYLNGDSNLANLHTLLSDIESKVERDEADVGQAYAAYTRENNGLVIFVLIYNPSGVLSDIQKVSAGVFKWDDSFDPPQVCITWKEPGQYDDRITNATYGAGTNSITGQTILDSDHAGWVWTCITEGVNLNKAPADVVVNGALTFELKNPNP